MIFLSTLLLSVLITVALVPVFSMAAISANMVDMPNERKVHTVPIPRIGGVAMALGAFVPILIWNHADSFVLAYLAGAAVLVVFGLVDDFRELSPWVKFAGQSIAALIAVLWGGVEIRSLGTLLPDGFLLAEWIGVPLTVVVIVGVTNAINLSDGLDGLAGGICLLIFCCISYLSYLDGNTQIGLVALSLAGVIFGFLRFNTHPASVFMGDAGSQFLGFSAVTLSLALTQGHSTPLSPLLPMILLGFPILDTLTVMVTRIRQGRSPFSADKNHFHHNLLALGFLHPESVLIIYLFQTLLLFAAVQFRYYPEWILLTGYLVFSLLVLVCFSEAARRGRRIRRFHFFDAKVAGRIRLLKREGTVIRHSFRIFEVGVPLLLLVTSLIARQPPLWVSLVFSACAILVLLALWLWQGLLPVLLRFVLYLLIPFAVYLSGQELPEIDTPLSRVYNSSFGVAAVLLILVSKFSRRKAGFQSSPMDFLIVILALVVPNLPEQAIRDYQLGLTAAKILLLYFSFEVLQAEMRNGSKKLACATLASLLALAL